MSIQNSEEIRLNLFDYQVLQKCFYSGYPSETEALMVVTSLKKLSDAELVREEISEIIRLESTLKLSPCMECRKLPTRKSWIEANYYTTAKGQAWFREIERQLSEKVLEVSCPNPPYPPGDYDER